MNFVLDASVALSWCFEDEGGEYAVGVLGALRSSEAVAASHWPLEIANGLLSAERRRRVDAAAADEFARLLLSLPIVVEPVDRRLAIEEVRTLGREYGLTAYGAAYLELARRLGVPLATLDVPLRQASEAAGVPIFQPDGHEA